QGPSPRHPIPP
uniref:Bradykinin-potentiating peptide 11a n=1 Tax=Crotalus viridis viridis TaxID=8742 RepID=BP11A_CROVV|nr:RecName: Full=Bradykinin-potentiating peptide 11a; Short=BPP-11a [Crotalus viridis viridis]